jgi:hypothetical protein
VSPSAIIGLRRGAGPLVRRPLRLWFAAAIGLLYLYSFPYFAALHSANELPRIYLAIAIVERGALSIGPEIRRYQTTVDTSSHRGKTYSNKPPGVSLLLVPAYAALKLIHPADPIPLKTLFFWLRLLGSTVPALLFLLLLGHWLRPLVAGRQLRRLLLAAYALGTMAMIYGTLLISHNLAALLLGTSLILLHRDRRGLKAAAGAGLAAGAAVMMEYPAAFVGPLLFAYLLWRSPGGRLRRALAFGLAAALPLGLLLLYHWLCFDNPLKTPNHFLADPAMRSWAQAGFLGFSSFSWARLGEQLFSPRSGLFFFSPFLLLALPGLVLMLRRSAERVEALLCAAVILFSFFFIGSLTYAHGGWTVGPRYIAYTLPFYLMPFAATLQAVRSRPSLFVPCAGLIGTAIVTYTTAAAVFPHYPSGFSHPWFDITVRFGAAGYLPYNLGWFFGLQGLASAIPYLGILAALLLALTARGPGLRRRLLHATAALAITALLFCGSWALLCQRQPLRTDAISWLGAKWDPRRPPEHAPALLRPIGPPRSWCERSLPP